VVLASVEGREPDRAPWDEGNGKPLPFCYRFQGERAVAGRFVIHAVTRGCTATAGAPEERDVPVSNRRYLRPHRRWVNMSGMSSPVDSVFANEEDGGAQNDLRQRISA